MIKDNIDKIKQEIPDDITLVAVSKTKSNDEISEAYDLSKFCKELYNYNNKKDNYIKEKQPMQLDNNTYLYITNLTLEYDDKYLSIEGYILYK